MTANPKSLRLRRTAPDRQFAGSRVGNQINIPNALLELIEYCDASFEQRTAIVGGLHSLRTTIPSVNAHRRLQIRN